MYKCTGLFSSYNTIHINCIMKKIAISHLSYSRTVHVEPFDDPVTLVVYKNNGLQSLWPRGKSNTVGKEEK